MLETIYNDFTTKLLPQIQQGLVITKDYFSDLFGRYVHYLFITDVITAILCAIGALTCFFAIKYIMKKAKEDEYWWEDVWPIFLAIFSVIGFILFIGFAVESTFNAVKDKYIPEIRVIEEIQSFRNIRS